MDTSDRHLRRIAQVILLVALAECVGFGALVAVRMADATSASVRTLAPWVPIRLDPATIVVAVPTADTAAPAAGVTGTTTLPALPVDPAAVAAAIAAEPAGIVAARSFSLGRATALDRARALECLTAAIYYEAATEPDAGQRAVAQVVLNRARHPAFPASVCGVVYQGSEHAGCQFSFACDGAMARLPARDAWARASRAAGAALAGYVYAPVGLATHYHTYAVTPAWNRGLVMTGAVGAHFFHRWKGYWGTAGAFRQTYAGNEPAPGPHTPVAAAAPVPAIAAVPATPASGDTALPSVVAPTVQPAYQGAGLPRSPRASVAAPSSTPTPRAGTTADDDQILPRWRDSGKPIER